MRHTARDLLEVGRNPAVVENQNRSGILKAGPGDGDAAAAAGAIPCHSLELNGRLKLGVARGTTKGDRTRHWLFSVREGMIRGEGSWMLIRIYRPEI